MTLTMSARPDEKPPFLRRPLHIAYTVIFVSFWIYSGLTTPDLVNWLLENTLTLSLVIFLASFYNIFRFSDTSYTLIFLFLLLHVYGSQYQYPENPIGEWLKENHNHSRNHYDRFVHFGFGLLLSYPLYEVSAYGLRLRNFLSHLLPLSLVLSLSAVYELLEWIVADLVYEGDEQGMAYLGMQGDIWDAQKDIGLALLGSAIAITLALLLRRRRSTLPEK
jgi:putative membrane protein